MREDCNDGDEISSRESSLNRFHVSSYRNFQNFLITFKACLEKPEKGGFKGAGSAKEGCLSSIHGQSPPGGPPGRSQEKCLEKI